VKTLFPEIRPYRTELLPVGDGHELYLECSGTETGIPVLVLHGGPGAGASEQMRRFFDPERYHIILFDQRGAGRSIPHACTEFNSVQHTIADIETIRKHLDIDKWLLFGGSFGATLALLYAEQYSELVSGLILRGVFLSRQQDLNWLYKEGAGRYFPDEWQDFISEVEGQVGHELIENYYQLLHGKNELARISAAKAWARWEVEISSFRPSKSSGNYFLATHTAIPLAKISSHYFRNHSFIAENQILENADKLAGIPGYIIHGRYDMICPPDQAYALSEKWQDGELHLVREGGHSGFDEAMIDALIRSTCRMAKRLGSPENEA
jgi:proline iminopeptidase